ncbi:MAG: hypothetical protein RBR71_04225 [Gudongella sp.]|nr:hypothetical protein [Gudongella sp.]
MDILELIQNKGTEYTRLEIIEELYWSALGSITENEMINIVKPYLMDSEGEDEYSAVQNLYSNPEGSYITLFEDVIMGLYNKNPYTFIRAVSSNPEIGMNVLYIFRNKAVFLESESIKKELLVATDDIETKEMIESFFKYYASICST